MPNLILSHWVSSHPQQPLLTTKNSWTQFHGYFSSWNSAKICRQFRPAALFPVSWRLIWLLALRIALGLCFLARNSSCGQFCWRKAQGASSALQSQRGSALFNAECWIHDLWASAGPDVGTCGIEHENIITRVNKQKKSLRKLSPPKILSSVTIFFFFLLTCSVIIFGNPILLKYRHQQCLPWCHADPS